MAFSVFTPREVCIVLTALAAALIALRLPARPARVAWIVLLVAGAANAVVMNQRPHNLLQSNVVHYYLGAKYPVPYAAFYETIKAALEAPQVGMRDLRRPSRFVRATESEARAYYIDLMREAGVPFEPLSATWMLRDTAQRSGAIRAEAEGILAANLPASRIDDFRRDVRTANAVVPQERLTHDAGFNGSPFYTLVRHIDPTLYLPLGTATAWLNLVWQCLSVLMLAWLAGKALDVDLNARLAMATLVFASWDFVSFGLPGLVFAGLWLPVAVALYAMRRGARAAAGVAVAWAGLVKLFPFALVLPALAKRSRASLRTLGACAAATVLLGLLAMLAGRSWAGFFEKIAVQFSLGETAGNSVSLARLLGTIGVGGPLTPLPAMLSGVALFALAGMFFWNGPEGDDAAAARRSLLLLASLGWVAHKWLNYYGVAALLLIPVLARRHRAGAFVCVLAMAVASFLPEFRDPVLVAKPAWLAAKLAPYVLIPAWMVAVELRGARIATVFRRIALAVGVLCLLATAGEAWRLREVGRLTREGKLELDRGDAAGAATIYDKLSRLSPRNHDAINGRAVARAILGDAPRAGADFAHAVRLDPEDIDVRRNYARFLQTTGRADEAAAELDAAMRLAPCDAALLSDAARVALGRGRVESARVLLARARELQPDDEGVRQLLERIGPTAERDP